LKHAQVKIPWIKTRYTPLIMGLPPHILLLADNERILAKLACLRAGMRQDMIQALSDYKPVSNVIANTILFKLDSIQDQMMAVVVTPVVAAAVVGTVTMMATATAIAAVATAMPVTMAVVTTAVVMMTAGVTAIVTVTAAMGAMVAAMVVMGTAMVAVAVMVKAMAAMATARGQQRQWQQ
jgi:hypothetical protein